MKKTNGKTTTNKNERDKQKWERGRGGRTGREREKLSSELGSGIMLTPGQTRPIGESETK